MKAIKYIIESKEVQEYDAIFSKISKDLDTFISLTKKDFEANNLKESSEADKKGMSTLISLILYKNQYRTDYYHMDKVDSHLLAVFSELFLFIDLDNLKDFKKKMEYEKKEIAMYRSIKKNLTYLNILIAFQFVTEEILSIMDNKNVSDEEFDEISDLVDVAVETFSETIQSKIIDENTNTFDEEENKKNIEKLLRTFTPQYIKDYLDKYIISQEDAKRTIAVSYYNHLKRCMIENLPMQKDNVLLIGPTGCGKTEIIRKLQDISPFPIVFFDTSNVTSAGYKGHDIDELYSMLYTTAKGEIPIVERSIIFLDEFDKILVPSITSSGADTNKEIQGQLLAMMEGTNISLTVKDGNGTETVNIDTSKMLFICAGAFEGLDKIIESKITTKRSIGFSDISDEKKEITDDIIADSLFEYGARQELMGRLPSIAILNELTEEDLLSILTKTENNILVKYQNEFSFPDKIELIYTPDFLKKVAKKAIKKKIGARGLNSILSQEMKQVRFEYPSKPDVKTITF